jgi:2-methylisocitrate lyase-like PEP mutase family enzyme
MQRCCCGENVVTAERISAPTMLRQRLQAAPVLAAGCFDALSARLAEEAGFAAVHISGLGVEASLLGCPDIGAMTRSDLLAVASRIVEAVSVPVICDIDTGFGDLLNVARTVRQFEHVGVAAVHIEDQSEPKTCPAYAVPRVVDEAQALRRLKTALAARTNPDLLIIARTDSFSISVDEAIRRANLFLDAGADMAMCPLTVVNGVSIHSLEPEEQYEWHRRFVSAVEGPVFGLWTPPGYSMTDMVAAGYHSMMMPTHSLRAAATAMLQMFEAAIEDGTGAAYFSAHPRDERSGELQLARILGLDAALAIREQFT